VGGAALALRIRVLGDVPVGDTRAAGDPHRRDRRVAGRDGRPLVRDEHGVQRQPVRDAEQDLLHVARRGVGVDPELHGGPPGAQRYPFFSRNAPAFA
jgi:hypothetical protein